MFTLLKTRMAQKHRTYPYPNIPPKLPDRFRGRPAISPAPCSESCAGMCATVCPTNAIHRSVASPVIDTGCCIFCGKCATACPSGAITFTSDYRLARCDRKELLVSGSPEIPIPRKPGNKYLHLFKRSFRLRQISAGGCNACEADTNVLTTLVYDLSRFGIQFVASPRHADGVLITGPVTKNMTLALKKTFDATPAPKVVIAVGACALSGGMFAQHSQVHQGADDLLPVDLYIPGCPPHPYTILDGLLRFLGRID